MLGTYPATKGIHKGGDRRRQRGATAEGKHSKNIQTYQQLCIEYVYRCIYPLYSPGIPIIPIILYSFNSLLMDLFDIVVDAYHMAHLGLNKGRALNELLLPLFPSVGGPGDVMFVDDNARLQPFKGSIGSPLRDS